MFELVYSRQALRTLRRLPNNLKKQIQTKLLDVAVDPYARHNNVTKLQNRPGYRLRVGDWRIIYDLQDEQLQIVVLRIGSRGEIYR